MADPDLVRVASNVATRYADKWAVERTRLDAAVAAAHYEKRPLVGDYWQAEMRARGKAKVAILLLEALMDE